MACYLGGPSIHEHLPGGRLRLFPSLLVRVLQPERRIIDGHVLAGGVGAQRLNTTLRDGADNAWISRPLCP
jgi:hypothetical protein